VLTDRMRLARDFPFCFLRSYLPVVTGCSALTAVQSRVKRDSFQFAEEVIVGFAVLVHEKPALVQDAFWRRALRESTRLTGRGTVRLSCDFGVKPTSSFRRI